MGDRIYEVTQESFVQQRTEAINKGVDFAFETNFHTDSILKTLNVFKQNDYRTILVFLALTSPEYAIERVKKRVLLGGHNVEESTIRERFKNGLKILDETFSLFDSVEILHSIESDVEFIASINNRTKRVHQERAIPLSLAAILPELSAYLKNNQSH